MLYYILWGVIDVPGDTKYLGKYAQGNDMGETNSNTSFYNLRAVVSQTGLNPATIRAWERRYGLPRPQRTTGGHRQYSVRDIDTLKWLIARQEEGMSIRHAIELWRSYVQSGTDPFQGTTSPAVKQQAQIVAGLQGKNIDGLRQAWVNACLDFDRETAEQILAGAFAQYNPETVAIELLQKGLAEVGNGWYEGGVTVQQEHFASALSVQRLELLIASAAPPTREERIVVATAPDDFHVFSPLLMTYLLRRRGWDVIYLGANVPAAEMEETIVQLQPALVIISAQLLHTAATLKGIAQVLQEQEVPLAFGGSVFTSMPDLPRLIPGHFLGTSLEMAIQKAAQLIQEGRAVAAAEDDPAQAYEDALMQFQMRRAAIESNVWEQFIRTNKPTNHLAEINKDFGETIDSALVLGDIKLLPQDMSWIEYLLKGYRLPPSLLAAYVQLYHEAAERNLGPECWPIVEWLQGLSSE